MAKRKRGHDGDGDGQPRPSYSADIPTKENRIGASAKSVTVQVVVGSYERILHGLTATLTISTDAQDVAKFTDTFLFSAHLSAIRCLALSPPSASRPGQAAKIILASGCTDERINLYHLSANAPDLHGKLAMIPSLNRTVVIENPKNRELGSLLHHSSSVTALCFPTRSKLLSAADDNTIAVTRTRDWTALSTIKAPIPVARGRPSGDTAPLGGTPSGVNDFAVHPSLKLMISVGKGEKCMRLWNLVTGKKAGVLSFGKEILQAAGEGKRASGEGRKVGWSDGGEEFAVAFERGAITFGLDSKPRCRVYPSPASKIHQLRYLAIPRDGTRQVTDENDCLHLLAVSTEDGRIIFYSADPAPSQPGNEEDTSLPLCQAIGQMGGKDAGCRSRVKDFAILPLSHDNSTDTNNTSFTIIAGSSDGAVRLWKVSTGTLRGNDQQAEPPMAGQESSGDKAQRPVKQIGTLVGTYETGNRISCLVAFVMLPRIEKAGQRKESLGDAEEKEEGEENVDSSDEE